MAKKKKKEKSGVSETGRTLVYAVLIAIVIRTVAFEPFNIPSGSMLPTLLVGDYLFVSKYAYGYSQHSMPFGIPRFSGRLLEKEPQRGDVIVFKRPKRFENDPLVDFIKRLVGLPGDRIQVLGGILNINGTPVTRERVAPPDYAANDRASYYVETFPNGNQHIIREESDQNRLDNTPVYVVPPEHYFFMGDNRDNSADSRVFRPNFRRDAGTPLTELEITIDTPASWEVGFVPAQNLIGRAEILFYSTDGGARFWEFWRWPAATRFSRIFDSVGGI